MLEIYNIALIGGGTAAVTFFGILLFLRFGRWLGKRVLARHGGEIPPSVGSLEAAVFALMGLLIAFTFSGALTRFDARRIQAVDEANAIGTAYLRIALLPASAQPKLRETMRTYVDARIATYRKLPDLEVAQAEAARSMQLQNEIWAQAVAATRLPDARAGADLLVIPAMNEMFDLASARIAATKIHPPMIVYLMLIALAFASALLAGYQSAGESHDWMRRLGFAVIIAFTVYVILEIEFPRVGFVRIDAIDQLLVNARASMN
jgi:hypothetical protein